MTVLAQNVRGSRFEITRLSTIPYKVFTSPSSNDSYAKLHRARAAMQYLDPSYLVQINGRELWTFSASEGVPPDPPLSFELFTADHGVLVTSTSQSQSGGEDSAKTNIFLKAVQSRINNHLVTSLEEFQPFGRSLCSATDGSLLHVTPALSKAGDLSVSLVVEKTRLSPLLQINTRTVWLIPQGREARLVDTFAAPSIALARQFFSVMQSIIYFDLPVSSLDDSMWIKVSLDGRDFLWPAKMARTQELAEDGLSWLSKPDPYSALYDSMDHMRKSLQQKDTENENPPAEVPMHQSTMYFPPPMPPPPPTPSASHESVEPPELNPAIPAIKTELRDQSHLQTQTQTHAHAPQSAAAAMITQQQALHSPAVWVPDSRAESGARSTPGKMEEHWVEDEDDEPDEEVTIADFNYFDLPIVEDDPGVLASPPGIAKSSPESLRAFGAETNELPLGNISTNNAPSLDIGNATTVLNADVVLEEMAQRHLVSSQALDTAALFSPLNLDAARSVDVDRKYSKGGRYFTQENGSAAATPKKVLDVEGGSKRGFKFVEEYGLRRGASVPESAVHATKRKRATLSYPENALEASEGDLNSSDDDDDDDDDDGQLDDDFSAIESYLEGVSDFQQGWHKDDSESSGKLSRDSRIFPDDEDENIKQTRRHVDAHLRWAAAIKPSFEPRNVLYIDSAGEAAETASAWLDALLAPITLTPSGIISNENLQALMAQVVWDNGMLAKMLRGVSLNGELETAGDRVISKIKNIFPSLRWITLAELLTSRSAMSADTPKNSTPTMPGAEVALPKRPPASLSSGTPRSAVNTPGAGLGEGSPSAAPSSSSAAPDEPAFTLLSPPLYSVTRMNQPHKARASVLRFWRVFGLQPNSQPRDIVFIMLTLASKRILVQTEQFLQALKATYEGCRLGTLELPSFGNISQGVLNISADLEYTNPDTVGDLFETLSAYLKRQLQGKFEDKQLLMFMAYPPSTRTSPLPLVRGYQAIKSTFPDARWMLASIESIVPRNGGDILPSQLEMVKLSLVLYDRWVSRLNAPGSQTQASAFSLARLVPHSINIKYSPTLPSQIFDEDPIMHVSYRISPDYRWIAVAWSDQWASVTKVEVFKVTGNNHNRTNSLIRLPHASSDSSGNTLRDASAAQTPLPQMVESVVGDIWARTMAICRGASGRGSQYKWRIAVMKTGSMESEELNLWVRAANAPSPVPEIVPTLYVLVLPYSRPLHVVDPGRQLFGHLQNVDVVSAPITAVGPSSPVGAPQTPSTPQDFQSPVNPGTPSSHQASQRVRNDNVIVTARDETHGIVYENILQMLDSVNVIASGVLVRPSDSVKQGHEQLTLYLAYSPTPYKQLIRQVLGQFRRLASLSECTGVTTKKTIVPWHVEATGKMMSALSAL